jgi:carnitine O-acetyltransferase
MTIDKVTGGFGGVLGSIKERPGQALIVTGIALGALAYIARTWGLPHLLKRQGYFESSAEGAVIKALTCLSRQKMDAFEEDLPPLTPPPFEQSCDHLKKEGEVLLEGKMLTDFLAALEEFRIGEGAALHERLLVEARGKGNYIQKIWEEEAYLKGRYLFGSNWFGLSTPPPPRMEGGEPQVIRATYMIEGALRFLDKIREKSLPPFFLGIPIPVSMKQFGTLFGSFRIPGEGIDVLQKSKAQEDYLVVMCRGNYYQVGMRQSREKLFSALKAIREDESPLQPQIGFLTAAHRNIWAQQRELLMKEEGNRRSLSIIEGAQLILCFEDETVPGLNGMSQIALLKMSNRHFDAGMQWIIDREGKCATNNEHTGAESTAQAQMLSDVLAWEGTQLQEGKLVAPASLEKGEVHLLTFRVDEPMAGIIRYAEETAVERAGRYHVSTFTTAFGKSVLKKAGVSPDAFMQMCNLLAFHRLTGELSAVYETAMMRFFKEGRTETIGTLTKAAKDLVMAMRDEMATPEMLKKAIEVHKESTMDAMRNRGHERHMLALKVLAGLSPRLFDDPGYRLLQRKRISSSQTPTDKGGGGFLPTEEDGVGISYIPRNDYFLMTVTTKDLDIEAFKACHEGAMRDLLALLQKRGAPAT